MILETSVKRQSNGAELHTRLVRAQRITDFMGRAGRVPTVAASTLAGLDLRLGFDGRKPNIIGWYVECRRVGPPQGRYGGHHVSHGHVETRPWLPLRDGARWTDKLGFRYFQTGPLLFVLNPRRP